MSASLLGVFMTYPDDYHNHYRFNETARRWEFDDGVGPWTPCASPLEDLDAAAGAVVLQSMSFRACPIDTTSPFEARDAVLAIIKRELYPELEAAT